MSANDENVQLIDLIGRQGYDNSGEPMPFANHPAVLWTFTLTFLVLSWIFVSFRLYVRLRVVRSPGWDDLFVFLYLMSLTVGSAAFIISIRYGTGQHFLLLTIGEVTNYLRAFYVLNGTLTLAASFVKLSLLFQYLRIFEKGTWPYRTSILSIVFASIWGLAFAILAFFPCANVSDFWLLPSDAHCWGYGSRVPSSFTGTFITHTTINMCMDLFILGIGVNLYFQPGLVSKTRRGLLVLFFMGAVVSFLSIWRLQTIIQYQAGYSPTYDPTWYGPISLLLGVLEVNVSSICASVPIFWPVLSPYLGTIFVTREIDIQIQHAYHDHDHEAMIADDTKSLSKATTGSHYGGHTRGESETELNVLGASVGERNVTGTSNSHYSNDYVMGQVDPLREDGPAPKSVVRSGSVRNKRRWYAI